MLDVPLLITATSLVLHGPGIYRFEEATTIARGFNSGAVMAGLGLPAGAATSIYTLPNDMGMWNGVSFQLAEGQTVTIPASSIPAAERYRLWVNGQWKTAPWGNLGFVPGDINLDGFLDALDHDLFKNLRESPEDSPERAMADFSGDGFVDPLDDALFWNTVYDGGPGERR